MFINGVILVGAQMMQCPGHDQTSDCVHTGTEMYSICVYEISVAESYFSPPSVFE